MDPAAFAVHPFFSLDAVQWVTTCLVGLTCIGLVIVGFFRAMDGAIINGAFGVTLAAVLPALFLENKPLTAATFTVVLGLFLLAGCVLAFKHLAEHRRLQRTRRRVLEIQTKLERQYPNTHLVVLSNGNWKLMCCDTGEPVCEVRMADLAHAALHAR